jgi:hypothetical protein
MTFGHTISVFRKDGTAFFTVIHNPLHLIIMGTMKEMHQNLSIESYAKNMGLMDKSDIMANSYIVSWKT